MNFDFKNYNIIGDYVPVNLEQYRPRYKLIYPYNVYGYNNLYPYQNYGYENYSSQNQYKTVQNFSNLSLVGQNNSNLANNYTDPNNPPVEKKTPDEPPDEGPINLEGYLRKYIQIKNKRWREFLAELIGTFVLCSFIYGGIAQYKFFTRIGQPVSFFSAAASCAVGVILGIIIAGKVSGGHLNPAISFAMYLIGRMTAKRMFIYMAAQFLGGFISTVIIYVLYFDILSSFGPGFGGTNTGGIFTTFPVAGLSIWGGFFDQVMGTYFLILTVLAATDNRNVNLSTEVFAFIVGIALLGIANSYGFNSGFAVNPARDFPARLFLLMANWGPLAFSAGNFFFWIPIVAPFIGSFLAVLSYILFISGHWHEGIQFRTQPHIKQQFSV